MKFTALLAALALSATAASAAPVQWTIGSGGNDHWYEIVTDSGHSVWADAVADAATRSHLGLQGYLATINSAAEQAFLNGIYGGGNGALWLGGSDAANEGVWQWVTEPGGPVAMTYTNWSAGEPNNCCGGENNLHGWWGAGGSWNDIYDGYSAYGFVVEYSLAAVPVPATLPLLGAGLAGLAALRRRKRG